MEDEISLLSSHALSTQLRPHHAMRRRVSAALINKADLTGLKIKLPRLDAIACATIWVLI